jgi:uncharacterized protein
VGCQTGREEVIVVFDSGIWVSALHFGGVPMEAIEYGLMMDEVLSCTQIEDEVIRIMRKKFLRTENSNKRRLASLLEGATRIVVSGALSGICRDPKDDFILECAETGGADLIVTGDKDLLSLGSFGAIEILTPRRYLDRAEDRPRCD